MNSRFLVAVPCAVVVTVGACSSSSGNAPAPGVDSGTSTDSGGEAAPLGPHPCDPLAAPSLPLTLAHLLGAGRHADGTLYVVDDGGREGQRAFISSGSILQRVAIAGSGSTGDWLSLSIDTPPVTIRIDQPGPSPTRMAIYRGRLDGKTFDPGSMGDLLTLVGADALAGLSPMNVADNVVIELDASLPDGRRLLVTGPKIDSSYEAFRVFFGTPSAMLERPLVNASGGNTLFITFTVDGVRYDAVIPAPPPLNSPDQKPTLTPAGAASIPLTLLATDAATAAGLAFTCL